MRSSCRWGACPTTIRRSSRALFKLTNVRGALITMPHKVTHRRPAGRGHRRRSSISGACNAVRRSARRPSAGRHVRWRGVRARPAAQGLSLSRVRARWSSGVAASVRRSLRRSRPLASGRWASSMRATNRPIALGAAALQSLSRARRATRQQGPGGLRVVVNATPLGMNDGDPLPMDVRASHPARSSAKS